MSEQGVNDFLTAAQNNEELQNLMFHTEDPETLASAAQQRGFGVEAEDFNELGEFLIQIATTSNEELSEEQLQRVSGGAGSSLAEFPITDLVFFTHDKVSENLEARLRQQMKHLSSQSGAGRSEMEITKMQNLNQKYNQAFESCTNIMKTNAQTLSAIIRNM